MKKHSLPPLLPGFKYVFRPWRTDPRTGKRLYARNYGFKAWPIVVAE